MKNIALTHESYSNVLMFFTVIDKSNFNFRDKGLESFLCIKFFIHGRKTEDPISCMVSKIKFTLRITHKNVVVVVLFCKLFYFF